MLIFYYSVLFLLLLFLFCFFLLFYYSVFSFWYFFYFIKKKCVTILCYVYFTILFSFYHFCCYFILELRRLIICSYIQNVFRLWDENYCWEYRIKHQDYCNAWHWKHWTKWRYPCSCEKTGPWHSWFDSWPIKLVLFQPDEALLTRSSGLKDLTLYVLVTLVQVKPGAV